MKKNLLVKLAVLLLTMVMLSGCFLVPGAKWHHKGGHGHGNDKGHHDKGGHDKH